ncbi:TonB-copper: TonB-dependent copper receptor [Tepidimonas alkaliphilus]|uniref:TonB-copper: TonB-dependent copper receptor n=2 Tax=Tepidimonas alkaliphilus TaxID=2588942 RepID=A0A554WBG4_9BURK|nr:TonB-copper: TonB-dependent copper receptor [Tepidimonas alkaliphilus]
MPTKSNAIRRPAPHGALVMSAVATAALAWSPAAAAQAQADAALPDVQVHAPRETDLPRGQAVQPRRARPVSADVSEALAEVPGAYTLEAGGLSRLPVLRGLGDERLRLQIDGMDLYAACPNHMNTPLSYLDPSQVERLQVWAGLAPVSAGGDAIGGVVAAQTPAPTFAAAGQTQTQGDLGLYARSNGHAWGLRLGAQHATQHWSLSYRLAAAEADNYRAGAAFKTYDFTGRAGHALPRDEVGSSAYRTRNHILGLAWQDGAHLWEAKLYAQDMPYQLYPNQRMDLLGNDSTKLNLRYQQRTAWGQWQARLWHDKVQHAMDFGPDKRYWYGMASGGGSSVDGRPCSPLGPQCAAGMPMLTDSATTGAKVQAEWAVSEQTVVRAGAELHRFRLDDYWPPSGGGMWPGTFWNIRDGQRDRHALYAEVQWSPAPLWSAQAGLRVERVRTDAGPVQGYSDAPNAMGRQTQDAQAFNALDRRRRFTTHDVVLSARHQPRSTFELEFGLARRERAPGLYELYPWSTWQMAALMNNFVGDGNGYVGNPNLRSERAYTASASAQWKAANDAWAIKVEPHVTQVRDFIDAERLPGQSGERRFVLLRYANVPARLYGLDLSGRALLAHDPANRWELRGQLSHLKGRNRRSGDGLYAIMPLNARLSLTHQTGAWESTVEWVAVKAKTDVSSVRNEVPTPGYGLMNVRAAYRLGRGKLEFGIDNVFDRLYALPTGGAYVGQGTTMTNPSPPNVPQWGIAVPGPGRSLWLAYQVAF